MSRRIYKYPLPLRDTVPLMMPRGAQWLHVDEQYDTPVIWAIVDTDAPEVTRVIHIEGTGASLPPGSEEWEHIGSLLMAGGRLVWHVFAEREV